MNIDTNDFFPGVSVDCVIFGFEENTIKVLLLKWRNYDAWALPGGYIRFNEDIDKAVERVLTERTGLKNIFLNQFKIFGATNRMPTEEVAAFLRANVVGEDLSAWFLQRFITIGHLALIKIEEAHPVPDQFSEKIEWHCVEQLPNLIFDHREIVEAARDELKNQLNYLPIGINLLPEKFTMGELQKLYERILGKKLDRGNFQKKILSLDILDRLEKHNTGGAHKAPFLYKFVVKKYLDRLNQGLGFS
jgi:ADP-ribose pyrophosphatase YjhB (NUDIX family)